MAWNSEEAAPPRADAGRQRLILLIQVLLTVLLLYFSFRGLDFRTALRRVWGMPLSAVGLCFLLFAVQMLILAWRWDVLVNFFRCKVSLWTLVRGVLAERLVNQLMPSTVGGDSARVLTVAAEGVPRGPAFLSVLFDRVSGLLGIVLFGGIMSPVAFLYGADVKLALMPAALAAGVLLVVLAVALMPVSLLSRMTDLLRIGRLIWLIETSHALLRSRHFLFATSVIAVLVHLLSCAVFVIIAEALLGIASSIPVIVCVPIILLATAAPITLAGWGVRESVSVALLQMFGISAEDALGISIMFGLIQLLTGLVSGLLLLGLQISHTVHKQRLLQPEQPRPNKPKS